MAVLRAAAEALLLEARHPDPPLSALSDPGKRSGLRILLRIYGRSPATLHSDCMHCGRFEFMQVWHGVTFQGRCV